YHHLFPFCLAVQRVWPIICQRPAASNAYIRAYLRRDVQRDFKKQGSTPRCLTRAMKARTLGFGLWALDFLPPSFCISSPDVTGRVMVCNGFCNGLDLNSTQCLCGL